MSDRNAKVARLTAVASGEATTINAWAQAFLGVDGFRIEDELSRDWCRLWDARVDNALVGFLLAWHVSDELHILHVVVAPTARRHGVGRALVEAALGYAFRERIRLALLEVRRSNNAAIGLYRAASFVPFNVRKRYYRDDEDAVEMGLRLDAETGARQAVEGEISLD